MSGGISMTAGASALRIGFAAEWIGEQVGGLERYAASLVRALVQIDSPDAYELFLTPRGCEDLADLAGPRARLHPMATNSRWYFVPVGLPLAALRSRVDVLHATFGLAPWCPGRAVVLTVHDLCPDVHPEFFPPAVRARVRWLLRRGAARADWVVTPSRAAQVELTEHYGFPAERVTVIPHGVAPALVDTGAKLADADAAVLAALPSEFVLYVGRFHARKNLERLLEAMARLAASRGEAVPLVIAGRDMWSEKALRERVAELGLASSVAFPGYVSDAALAHLYRRARAFAFPTLHEGFGMPVLEAMAHGVPVLSSNVSSLPEVCGDAAVLVDPTDSDAIAAGLARLLDDSVLRARLAQVGPARAKEFTWERSAREHLAVYRMLGAQRAVA
jgi:glycosyltransferase involved in cell wall biosynthesis